MRQKSKRTVGSSGENYASMMLSKEGYSIMCRNYTCPEGEVDLIATKQDAICFVEVKLRSISSGDSAAGAVDSEKLSKIKKTMEYFLNEYKDNIYVNSLVPRIDVIEIYTGKSMVKKYCHIENIG